jgi:hypothetical protein
MIPVLSRTCRKESALFLDFSAANVDRLFRLCYSDTERLEKSYIRQQSQLFFMRLCAAHRAVPAEFRRQLS